MCVSLLPRSSARPSVRNIITPCIVPKILLVWVCAHASVWVHTHIYGCVLHAFVCMCMHMAYLMVCGVCVQCMCAHVWCVHVCASVRACVYVCLMARVI